MSLYETLGVEKDATPEQIKKAYKRAAQSAHPDRDGGCEDTFKQIKEAYEVLSSDERRFRYDSTGLTDEVSPVDERINQVFAVIVNNCDMNEDVVRLAEDKVKHAIIQNENLLASMNSQLKQAEACLGRVTNKNGDKCAFQDVIEGRVSAIKTSIDECRRELDVLDGVLRELEGYTDTMF